MFRIHTPIGFVLRRTADLGYTLVPSGPGIGSDTSPLQSQIASRQVELSKIQGDATCQICMEDNIPVMTKLECQHTMCIKCCQQWLDTHTTCPFCRNNLAENPITETHATINPDVEIIV